MWLKLNKRVIENLVLIRNMLFILSEYEACWQQNQSHFSSIQLLSPSYTYFIFQFKVTEFTSWEDKKSDIICSITHFSKILLWFFTQKDYGAIIEGAEIWL